MSLVEKAMSAVEKHKLERAAKVAQVIAENPNLPIKVLAPSTPSDLMCYNPNINSCGVGV